MAERIHFVCHPVRAQIHDMQRNLVEYNLANNFGICRICAAHLNPRGNRLQLVQHMATHGFIPKRAYLFRF
jgi:hypothetical protein